MIGIALKVETPPARGAAISNVSVARARLPARLNDGIPHRPSFLAYHGC